MEKELRDLLLEEDKSFEELMKEFDENELWEKYIKDHLKEKEEYRKRINLKKQKKNSKKQRRKR
jgi:hypothetical protein